MTVMICMLLLPLAGAAAALMLDRVRHKFRDIALRLFTILELVLSLCLFAVVWNGPREIAWSLPDACGLGLTFRADGFRSLYALLACFMWAMASQLSMEYFAGHGHHLGRYAFFTLVTECGVVGVFLSDDLYTAFVFFEIMSIASYPWVAHEETGGALRASATYLGVSIACGMVTLMGMFLCWRETGDLSFDGLRTHANESALVLPACLMLVGYCAKAGMAPLHIWLPKAHPVAPAPASALLSGMLTKTGLFGVIAISMNLLEGNALFGHILLGLGLVTMTLGAVLAVFSVNLKRTLACSSLSQIGYITVGLSCALLLGHHGALAAAGAVGHMVNHSLLKLCLFLCAGAIYMKTHTLDLNRLRGFGRGKWLLHGVFLIGALGLAGVPLLNGYTSKTMIHEGLVELAEEVEGFSLYRLCEWIFLFAAGLTTAYMLKLYICLFWQKNADPRRQMHYDALNPRPMTLRSAVTLGLTAVPLLLIGLMPNQTLLPLSRISAPFLNRPALSHEVAFFSLTNLMGGGVSLAIGAVTYLFFVRRVLCHPTDGYVDRWPAWLDLEELFYRPVFCRFLPWLGCSAAAFISSIPDSRLIREWIPGAVSKYFAFLDHLADSRLIREWIPGSVKGIFSFLDRLPESKLFTKILPGICLAIGRVFDQLLDHTMLLGREMILTNRQELRRTASPSMFHRLADTLAEALHRIGMLPKKWLPRRDESNAAYGNSVTNAISFGLLLAAVGLVAAIVYVFVRMGAA